MMNTQNNHVETALKVLDSLAVPETGIYNSTRHYPNGPPTVNKVLKEHITDHVTYNVSYRPGCSLFIQGICVYDSSPQCVGQAEAWSQAILKNLKPETSPTPLRYS
jgi:hypothetical protein